MSTHESCSVTRFAIKANLSFFLFHLFQAQTGGITFVGGANSSSESTEDFQTKHARLQAEARQALSQAKEMARLQMAQV